MGFNGETSHCLNFEILFLLFLITEEVQGSVFFICGDNVSVNAKQNFVCPGFDLSSHISC